MSIQDRKKRHIELARDTNSQMKHELFKDFELPYTALPELSLDDVSTETTLLSKKVSQPLIIASMTGGSLHSKVINAHLAEAAEELQVAMGVGSQRVALEVDDARESFELVRRYAPTIPVFANMAAVQLNYGYRADEYQRVVDMIEADALYLHINPLQEALQPEGNTDFSHLYEKIEAVIMSLTVPVYVKEVGHGLDVETVQKLVDIGVAGVDLAGTGGTSWSWIEAERTEYASFSQWFKEFGVRTDELLVSLMGEVGTATIDVVVSGGIRSPLQGLKAHLLGAQYYSAAYPFLEAAIDSTDAVTQVLEEWQKGLQVAMFCCGIEEW